MEKRYQLNPDAAIYDNGTEICMYWANEAKGTVLRGMGVYLFRTLQNTVGQMPFDVVDLDGADPSIDRENWQEIVDLLLQKGIVVKERASGERMLADRLASLKVGICGSAGLRDLTVQALADLGFQSLYIEGTDEARTEQDLLNCDLVLLVDEEMDIRKHLTWNRLTSGRGIPFLSLRLFGNKFEVGPLVLAGQCACFDCYWQRMQAGSSAGGPPQWFLDREGGSFQAPRTALRDAVAAIAVQHAAIECWRFAQEGTVPLSLGHVVGHDVEKGLTQIPAILEVPGCPTCASGGVLQR